jgi:hypothetical protein
LFYRIEHFVYFIKNAEDLEVIPESVKDIGLKNAYNEADKHNWTKAELEAYDYVLMREQDDRGRVSFAVKNELKQVAKKLLQIGLSLEDIAKSTGLTLEQLKELQAEK